MEFSPRLGPQKCSLRPGSSCEGVPVVTSYRYLGLVITQKLSLDLQQEHIEEKTKFQITVGTK